MSGIENAQVMESNVPHAIEVAAMLGDSVVGVKHCIDPKSGRISRGTWALVGIGAGALVMAAIAFAVSVATAAANERALATWTHVLHRPASAFRAERLSFAWDWLAFGGFAIAVGALAYALVRWRGERRSPYYRIGTAPEVEQPCEGAPAPSFPLVAPAGNAFVFQFAPGIEAELLDKRAPNPVPLTELVRIGHAQPVPSAFGVFALPIPHGARIRARAGKTTFLVTSVPRPARQATASLMVEGRALKYFGGSLAAHLLVWAVLAQIPVDGGAPQVELGMYEDASLRASITDQEDPSKKPDPTEGNDGDQGSQAAVAMKMPEGKAGKETGTAEQNRLQVKHNADVDLQFARRDAVEKAREAGLLGSYALTGAIASTTSDADFSSGFDTQNVHGPIYGADGATDTYGFGYGRDGFGPGGGGWGTIGSGRYGVICRGDARGCGGSGGDGFGPGHGIGTGPGHRRPAVPTVAITEGQVLGDLDKSIIRRYIKRNLEKITYCYEHELLAKPELAGTITVQFFIQPDGTVGQSNASGFDHEVASCVAGVVKAIEFPRPNGNGGVTVNYPFNFRAAGR
ncbi:MAG TPA: AgmX/PglI C-terminal domain-containing protein [Kofleriaceae bacterium]|nr:AgmX/PglI C-terminal domain-containing protein [Kofleriaceae bacterium]